MTMTQDAPSEYPLLEACILINTFQNNEPENKNKNELNKTKKKHGNKQERKRRIRDRRFIKVKKM